MTGRAKISSAGSIELGFGSQYVGLVCSGFLGTIPLVVWSMTLAMLFAPFASGGSSTGGSTVVEIAGGFAAVLLLGLPCLVPCLALRARQPRRARIAWDDEEVVEWDGPWKRAVVAWSRAEVGHLQWNVGMKGGAHHAVQIVDGSSGATITVWETQPRGAPVVRRRLTGNAKDLVRALEQREIAPSSAIDASRVIDPDRPRRAWVLVLGRMGYFFAVAAPLGAPDLRWPGYVLGAFGAALLALRASPVFHELRAVLGRLASARAPSEDPGRAAALRLKLRAVGFEAFARAAMVALVVASTIAGASVFHR